MNMHDDQVGSTSAVAGTPMDYSEDLYQVYFEVGEYENMALKILLPIQVIPEVVRALVVANIAVYQVVRQSKARQGMRRDVRFELIKGAKVVAPFKPIISVYYS